MITLNIKKIKEKVILPEEDFQKLLKSAKKNDEIEINFDDEFEDMTSISSESLDFWNNEIDDKIWNNA